MYGRVKFAFSGVKMLQVVFHRISAAWIILHRSLCATCKHAHTQKAATFKVQSEWFLHEGL